ncbi:hypothetical protein [Fredinandcohnia sp. 179-A 10B2 NHS]|uniref:hypothetical protein n=1 Tax=Fredinandcohnia sp. 179-A 10B2 NHS TaxID=3235176 RepID=UPI0039A0D4DB
MLKTIITIEKSIDIQTIIKGSALKKQSDTEFILVNDKKELARITISEGYVTFSYDGSLKFSEYEQIHNAILTFSQETDGSIDDSGSKLGFLDNGEPAYIITNWSKWTEMLNKAKYKTLEGQMVRVVDKSGNELGNGMLVDYKFKESVNLTSVISECTLITLLGERKYQGDVLFIEPTGQW